MEVICITGKRGAGDAIDTFISQGVPFNFHQVDAVYDKPVHHGIKLAHVAAQQKMMEFDFITEDVVIVEDDIFLTHPNSVEHFLECKKTATELGFDIILGGVHHMKYESLNLKIAHATQVSGMHMYSIINPTVDLSKCPKSEHIDNWVGKNFKVAVCIPMVATQRAGWSEHKRSNVDYVDMFERYPILR